MPVSIFVRIADPFGTPLIDVASGFVLDYLMNCAPGGIGVLELTLSPGIDTQLLLPDGRVGVYRAIDGRAPYLDNDAIYLIETIKITVQNTHIRAFHAKTLVQRRYVLYNASTSYSNKSATFADNLIKAFWRENAGSLVNANRDGVLTQADLSSYVQVQPDLSLGPSIAMSGSRDPLFNVIQRICDASETAGTYLTYDIVYLNSQLLEFRTYVSVYGVDRGANSGSPLVLSESRGNLENATVTTDYHSEVTFVSAGGQGQADDRLIATSFDESRTGTSPFHRIERFADMSNANSPTALQAQADATLRNNIPNISVSGSLVDTQSTTRGIHYDLGDILVVESPIARVQYNVRLEIIHEHYDASGSQQSQDLTSHQVQHRYTTGGLRSI